jgi:heat shock 70kDa protein 1/2/6/8
MNAQNTIYNAKRLIGRLHNDAVVNNEIQHWPCKIWPDSNNYSNIGVQYLGESFMLAPEQIGAIILRSLKEKAEKYLELDVHDAVITVPALFDDRQREVTKNAAKIAGLNV